MMKEGDREMPRPNEDDRQERNDAEARTGGESNEAGQSPIEVKVETGNDLPAEVEKTSDDDVAEDAAEEAVEEAQAESERFLRLAAEFDNYKKRTAREFGDIIKRANVRLLRELVDIVDNFERALSVDSEDHTHQAYRQGVELIYNQLSGLLTKEGVTPIEAVGKPFDPHFHEAVMQVESDKYDEGIVTQEIQKGYRIGDKVLRHSQVVVSRRPSEGKDEKERNAE